MNHFIILAILAAFGADMAFSKRRSLKHRDADEEMCMSGDGSSYRGHVSTSAYGHRCLRWSKIKALQEVGRHNYCRNPDQSLMPWCVVRRGRKIVREFCSIPKCTTPTTKPMPAVDNERTCGERSERRMNKVVGGSFTAIESHPWVAAIYYQGRFLCGGSLISPCWVLTAAHCFADIEQFDVQSVSVYLGKTAINETDADREQHFNAEKIITHEKYHSSGFDNDIALLMLRSQNGGCAVKSASTRTVCLPPSDTQLPAGFQCSVAGFGKESFGAWHFSKYLKQANVKLLSKTDCTKELSYQNLVTENMICAGSPDWTSDACEGDSGGPLVCEVSGRMFLFGVVSWGDKCAMMNKPGVYTRVTNYNKWIAEQTGLKKYTTGQMYPTK
ncbi:tissue-type plasminogen activator-like [Echeneis naucrates]|uniref:trypsin n=1 Tax=Echeneis naucrates TaxID=173247 RepID=A0A665TXJ7_ECHNA|nr:tissue-type plasminogen activator-like [Echeneis naucrates]